MVSVSPVVNQLRLVVHRRRLLGMRNGSKAKVPEDDRQKQTQVRMSDALKARIRKYQQKIHKDTGFTISFSTAVRTLIERGLDEATA
jgi:hypothetical protein